MIKALAASENLAVAESSWLALREGGAIVEEEDPEADDEDEGEDDRGKKTPEINVHPVDASGAPETAQALIVSTPTPVVQPSGSEQDIKRTNVEPTSENAASTMTPKTQTPAQPSFETPPPSDVETTPAGQDRPSTLLDRKDSTG